MEHRRLVHGAAPPLTSVERFLYGQKNDTLYPKKQDCSRDRHPAIMKKTKAIETKNDNKENLTFGPRKDKHLVANGGISIGDMVAKDATRGYHNPTKKRPFKNLIKGQWTAEEDRYICYRIIFM